MDVCTNMLSIVIICIKLNMAQNNVSEWIIWLIVALKIKLKYDCQHNILIIGGSLGFMSKWAIILTHLLRWQPAQVGIFCQTSFLSYIDSCTVSPAAAVKMFLMILLLLRWLYTHLTGISRWQDVLLFLPVVGGCKFLTRISGKTFLSVFSVMKIFES